MSPATSSPRLHTQVRTAAAWSTLSNLTLRIGSLAIGIVLARLLAPEQFGVYAVALTVQSVLMTLADLGLSADLIRSADPRERAPSVATLGLLSGLALTALTVGTAGAVAELLGSPESAAPIRVLSLTLLLAGIGVVPYALLNHRFEQRKLFAVAMTDFVVGAVVTLTLISAGWGVMALAVGRVVAQSVSLLVQFRLARTGLVLGFRRETLVSALRFGLPVGAANLLSWALLSIDTVVIAQGLGAVQLGFYVLAFNISTWPMSALGQVVRSVALPGFARLSRGTSGRPDPALADASALVWLVALPAGALLAALAPQVIAVLYGGAWAPSAPILVALGVFGALRVAFDLFASYLLARGAARATLLVQVCWFAALLPAVVVGTHVFGLRGAAWAHVLVSVLVILPAYLVVLHRAGADLRRLGAATWPPVLAVVPAAVAALVVADRSGSPFVALLGGGLAGVAVYAALLGRWAQVRIARVSRSEPTAGPVPGPVPPPVASSVPDPVRSP